MDGSHAAEQPKKSGLSAFVTMKYEDRVGRRDCDSSCKVTRKTNWVVPREHTKLSSLLYVEEGMKAFFIAIVSIREVD